MSAVPTELGTPWAVLARAISERRPVRARYHGYGRVLCPHVLGWKNGRPKVLAYQTRGATSSGPLPVQPEQRWRSLYVDEIEDATIAWDCAWQTADNYTASSNCIDEVALSIHSS